MTITSALLRRERNRELFPWHLDKLRVRVDRRRRPGQEKQITRVLDAVRAGASTTRDIARATGLSIKLSGAWMQKLEIAGAVERTGEKVHANGPHRSGMKFVVWVVRSRT